MAQFLLALLSITSLAAGPQTPPTKTISLSIDGKPVSVAVVKRDGKFYAPLEDLALAMGASFTTSQKPDGTISLLLTTKTPESKPLGAVKGVITYFFNRNFGSKPDVGARIWLAEGDVSIAESDFFEGGDDQATIYQGKDAASPKSEQPKVVVKIAATSTASGDGTFELKDVLPGKYTVIIESKHRKELNSRDVIGVIVCHPVKVSAGKSIEVSHDFGVTSI